MIKPVKDRKSWLFDQIWNIRNTSSTLPIQDKKRNTSSMNELGDISSRWRKGIQGFFYHYQKDSRGGKEGIKLLRNFHLTKVKQNFFLFLWTGAFKKNKLNKVLYLPINGGKQYAKQ
jgi:hypothetical protein